MHQPVAETGKGKEIFLLSLLLNSCQCSILDEEGQGAGVTVHIGQPPGHGAWWRRKQSGICGNRDSRVRHINRSYLAWVSNQDRGQTIMVTHTVLFCQAVPSCLVPSCLSFSPAASVTSFVWNAHPFLIHLTTAKVFAKVTYVTLSL